MIRGPVAAVTRYELALLVRSRRWLPPLILLGFVLATATAGGPPAADALAFGGAALVPACAWLTRITLVGDPPAARACLMAAAGPARTQVGCLVAALVAACLVTLATLAVLTGLVIAGGGVDDPGRLVRTVASGLVTGLACAVLGVGLGAVANPPVLRRADAAVAATGLGVVLALAAAGSPAYAAIDVLSRVPADRPAVPVAWGPLLAAFGVLLSCGAVSVGAAVRRGVH